MENSGTASEFDVIERNTIWAEALNANNNEPIEGAREFELEHWENMLKQGHKLLWKRVEHKLKEQKNIKKADSQLAEIPELQVEVAQMELNLKKEQIKLVKLQQKELKNRWKYFALGLLAGLLANLPKIISFIN